MTTTPTQTRQSVLKLTTLTAACERFGFYVILCMIVLYTKAEFSFSDSDAFELFAVIMALSYMLPMVGGYFANNLFGVRRSLVLGLAVEGLGLFLLAIPVHFLFPFALAMVVIGAGLFKSAPIDLLEGSYKENDQRVDSGFALYYMGFNLGGFVSAVLTGIAERYFGWHMAFLVGGVSVFIGLLIYFFLRNSVTKLDSPIGKIKLSPKIWIVGISIILLASFCCSFLLSHVAVNNILFTLMGIFLIGYYVYEMQKATHYDRMKIAACLLLILIEVVYFVLYFQAYTSVELFIDRVVNRDFMGVVVPTEAYMGLNPILLIILGPMLAFFYRKISVKYGKDLSIMMKFALGLLVISVSFLTLVLGILVTESNTLVSSLWVIIAFCFYTLGEMLVTAIGIVVVKDLVPEKMYGIAVGTWFFGCALAALLSGWLASFAGVADTMNDVHAILIVYQSAFTKIGLAGLAVTAIVFLVGSYIKKMSEGNLARN